MITSSHNPAEWNGVKYKASYGGSGKPSIIAAIESYLGMRASCRAASNAGDRSKRSISRRPTSPRSSASSICSDQGLRLPLPDRHACTARARGISRGSSAAPGCRSWRCAARSTPPFRASIRSRSCRTSRPRSRRSSSERCDAGLITDGDADRIGAVDEHGNVVDAHKIFAILLQWLLERKQLARRRHPRLQHHQDARPHRRQARPQAA